MDEPPTVPDGPVVGDAFGAALLACWEASVKPYEVLELIERDDGYLDGADAARYFAPPESWDALEHSVCERACGRVLDIGSGGGRIALYLQERGLDVTALDVSPLAGEVCRRRGVRQVFTGTVSDLVAARPALHRPFDTFLLMGNNLGLFGGVEQASRFLATLASLALPGATVMGTGMDPYRTTQELHLAYHARNRALGRMGGQIRMRVRHRRLATDWFDYLFATPDELRSLLEGTRWRLEHLQPRDNSASYAAQLRLT